MKDAKENRNVLCCNLQNSGPQDIASVQALKEVGTSRMAAGLTLVISVVIKWSGVSRRAVQC